MLYADQQSYVSTLIDTVINTAATLIGIAVVLYTRSYTQQLFVLNDVVTFIINGIICEACFILFALICCKRIPAQKKLEQIVLGMLKKTLHR